MELGIGHALCSAFRNDLFLFGYSGDFVDEHTGRLLQLSDGITEEIVGKDSFRKKLAFVLMEAYQNIVRHRADLPPHVERWEGRSFFLFRANPNGQDLVSINGMAKRNVPAMAEQLDAVRGLDHAELKDLSLRMLQLPSRGRGAGVGLIEMARRSGNDLGWMLRGLGPEHELFALAVRLGNGYSHEKIMREGAVLHGTVVMNDILLFHTGVMPPNVRKALADMVREDTDLQSARERARLREAMYTAAIEAMGNGHSGVRGVCVLAREGAHYALVHGTVMAPEEALERIAQLQAIAALDRRDLDIALLDRLMRPDQPRTTIGLYKLAAGCKVPLTHASYPMDGGVLVLVKAVF